MNEEVGVVIIGRNEGERLNLSINSVLPQANRVVYVDSGSTDDSVKLAASLGCEVIELDPSTPFSAARGRNAGYRHLIDLFPELKYIQFLDGDCVLDEAWIQNGVNSLETLPNAAVAFGRRHELYPDESIYNRLCDLEWDVPIGERRECGGDAMMSIAALREVNGYNPEFAAGEEPEMCYRMRQKGWKVYSVRAEMSHHDAAMHKFSQWSTRTMRSGSAYAQSMWTHGRKGPEYYAARESFSIWFWAILPILIIALAFVSPWFLLIFLAYPVLAARIYRGMRKRDATHKEALLYAGSCIIGKYPQLRGQLRFLRHRRSSLIEYKAPVSSSDA